MGKLAHVHALLANKAPETLAEELLATTTHNNELHEALKHSLTERRHLELELRRHVRAPAAVNHQASLVATLKDRIAALQTSLQQLQQQQTPSAAAAAHTRHVAILQEQLDAATLTQQQQAGVIEQLVAQADGAQLDAAAAAGQADVAFRALQEIGVTAAAAAAAGGQVDGRQLGQDLLELLEGLAPGMLQQHGQPQMPVNALAAAQEAHKLLLRQALLLRGRLASRQLFSGRPSSPGSPSNSCELDRPTQLFCFLRSHMQRLQSTLDSLPGSAGAAQIFRQCQLDDCGSSGGRLRPASAAAAVGSGNSCSTVQQPMPFPAARPLSGGGWGCASDPARWAGSSGRGATHLCSKQRPGSARSAGCRPVASPDLSPYLNFAAKKKLSRPAPTSSPAAEAEAAMHELRQRLLQQQQQQLQQQESALQQLHGQQELVQQLRQQVQQQQAEAQANRQQHEQQVLELQAAAHASNQQVQQLQAAAQASRQEQEQQVLELQAAAQASNQQVQQLEAEAQASRQDHQQQMLELEAATQGLQRGHQQQLEEATIQQARLVAELQRQQEQHSQLLVQLQELEHALQASQQSLADITSQPLAAPDLPRLVRLLQAQNASLSEVPVGQLLGGGGRLDPDLVQLCDAVHCFLTAMRQVLAELLGGKRSPSIDIQELEAQVEEDTTLVEEVMSQLQEACAASRRASAMGNSRRASAAGVGLAAAADGPLQGGGRQRLAGDRDLPAAALQPLPDVGSTAELDAD